MYLAGVSHFHLHEKLKSILKKQTLRKTKVSFKNGQYRDTGQHWVHDTERGQTTHKNITQKTKTQSIYIILSLVYKNMSNLVECSLNDTEIKHMCLEHKTAILRIGMYINEINIQFRAQ